MIAHAHHIQEERLFDCYLAARGGAPPDPPIVEHLDQCADCSQRYAELTRFMSGLRKEADMESDAVFPPERLHAQRQQIARRLEHASRAARVISFPERFVSRRVSSTPRVATRWIAAAAAAGLFVGVAVGMFSESRAFRASLQASANSRREPSARPAYLTPVATLGSSSAPKPSDDEFMSDLEIAIERPHTPELLSFDALTPHVREVSNQVR